MDIIIILLAIIASCLLIGSKNTLTLLLLAGVGYLLFWIIVLLITFWETISQIIIIIIIIPIIILLIDNLRIMIIKFKNKVINYSNSNNTIKNIEKYIDILLVLIFIFSITIFISINIFKIKSFLGVIVGILIGVGLLILWSIIDSLVSFFSKINSINKKNKVD